jgi:hypothetical protein
MQPAPPAMMVWPDSSSVRTRNDGSSCETRRCDAHLFLIALRLGSIAIASPAREDHLLEHDHFVGGAWRIARHVFQTDGGAIARARFFLISSRLFASQQTADTFFLPLVG